MKSTPAIGPVQVILLGDPAAGKATQAAHLVTRFSLFDFDMGKELSRQRAENRELDALLERYNDKGKLTPTAIVRRILRNTVSAVPASQGILFDGHPKMLGEAKIVAKLLKAAGRQDPLVIYLSVPIEETVRRMKIRTGYFDGKFGKRADDTEQALKNRVRYYRTNIAQVIEFFRSRYSYHKISGIGSEREVTERIDTIMNKHVPVWEN